MYVNLLYKNKDIELYDLLIWNHETLMKDLSLSVLIDAMANNDEYERNIVKRVILSSNKNSEDVILYRQNILKDFLTHQDKFSELFELVVEAIKIKQKNRLYIFSAHPSFMLYSAASLIQDFVPYLYRMRKMADDSNGLFTSEGVCDFLERLQNNFTDHYIKKILGHLDYLKQHDDLYCSAQLGAGNFGINYTLHEPLVNSMSWWRKLLDKLFGKKSDFIFTISSHDESGIRALTEIKDQCLSAVASYLTQTSDSIFNFLCTLHAELLFYKGCINLYKKLMAYNVDVCFPIIDEKDNLLMKCSGLYDISLLFSTCEPPISNDLFAGDKKLVVITGANRGGKTTFLRSIGIAQLMTNSGMFVPSRTMSISPYHSLFTHFRRREDKSHNSGKLDEELCRMDELIKHVQPNSWILFNESFAATNENEGSEIAKQIVLALHEKGVKILFVTHLYSFAESIYNKDLPDCLFLRAERTPDTCRTYKIIEGRPFETSYGLDIYNKIFHDNGNSERITQ